MNDTPPTSEEMQKLIEEMLAEDWPKYSPEEFVAAIQDELSGKMRTDDTFIITKELMHEISKQLLFLRQKKPQVLALVKYIRTLEREKKVLYRALKDISVMQAEDNFKSWKDKVNDVQTWQEQFFNEVILKPVNEYAKEALSSVTPSL